MKLFDYIRRMCTKHRTADEELYQLLMDMIYEERPYQKSDIGDDMFLIDQLFSSWWKPRFLIDEKTKCAYEFMDIHELLTTVKAEDIDWKSLKNLPEAAINTAKYLSFHYPSFIGNYRNGVGEVRWRLNPDGSYYMDDDGFGMTDDDEVIIYGYVDRKGKPLTKFKYILSYKELDEMRQQAESKLQ